MRSLARYLRTVVLFIALGMLLVPAAAASEDGPAASTQTKPSEPAPIEDPEPASNEQVKSEQDHCAGLQRLPRSDRCTHGGDPAPPGRHIDQDTPRR